MDYAYPSIAIGGDRVEATLRSRATMGGGVPGSNADARRKGEKNVPARKMGQLGKDLTGYSFISKFITHTVNGQDVMRLTRLDFNPLESKTIEMDWAADHFATTYRGSAVVDAVLFYPALPDQPVGAELSVNVVDCPGY